MNSTDSQRILHFYKDSLAEYGSHDARSVHWSDPQGQEIRFRVLSQIANLNGQNVLDVGCGLGDLLTFFEKKIRQLFHILALILFLNLSKVPKNSIPMLDLN
jgi:2-polyprenyl-3-methyl-5-hydroxy-6-metoxy-1,4-benzoquinol methylase